MEALLILFTFAISSHTKYLNNSEEYQKYADPYANIDILSPKLDCDTSSSKFEWQNRQPSNLTIFMTYQEGSTNRTT